MSLIKCTECQNDISDMAVICPKCGNKIASNTNQNDNKSVGKKKLDAKYVILIVVGCVLVFIVFIIILFNLFFVSYKTDDSFEYEYVKSGTYGYTIRNTLDLNRDGTCTHTLYSYFPILYKKIDETYDCSYKINRLDETIIVTYTDGSSDDTGIVNFDGNEIYSIIFDDDLDEVYYNEYY